LRSRKSWHRKNDNCAIFVAALLFEEKAPVVYTNRKPAVSRHIFYEFIPLVENEQVTDTKVKVYFINANEKGFKIPSMKRLDAFYVVDPGQFDGSCNDTAEHYKVRFIMAASNDLRHWGGNDFKKFRELHRDRITEF